MENKYIKSIKEIYKNTSYEIRLKAPIFFFMSVFVTILSFVILILRLIDKFSLIVIISYILSYIVIIYSLIIFRKGNYNHSAIGISFSLMFNTVIIRYVLGYDSPLVFNQFGAILIVLFLIGSFFINSYKAILTLGGFTFLSFVFFVIFVYFKRTVDTSIFNLYNQIVTPAISIPVIIVVAVGIRKLFDKIIEDIQQKLYAIELQKKKGQELIDSSGEQLKKTTELYSSIKETSEATLMIEKNIAYILDRISMLKNKFEASNVLLDSNNKNFDVVAGQFENQITNITESSSAVQQMVQSIENVSHIVSLKKTAVSELIKTSAEGNLKIKKTNEAFGNVFKFINKIEDIAKIIGNISAQTNLLSMNAAIEAAHANESGKGFAVVAEEIRSLAATSAVNTKEIKDVIKELVSAIRESDSIIGDTGESFNNILSEIKSVESSMDEIEISTKELSLGNKEILSAIANLNNITGVLKENFEEVNESNNKVSTDIKDMSSYVVQIADNMQEIDLSIQQIKKLMDTLLELSKIVTVQTEKLNTSISD